MAIPWDYQEGHAFDPNATKNHGLALYGQDKRRGIAIHFPTCIGFPMEPACANPPLPIASLVQLIDNLVKSGIARPGRIAEVIVSWLVSLIEADR